MRRITVLLAAVALMSGGTLAVIACGGSDDPVVVAAPDAATTSSSSSSTGGTSSGDPGTTSGGLTDATTEPVLVSNPLRYTCGTSECDAGGGKENPNACCAAPAGGAATCVKATDCNAQGDAGNLLVVCDESADCPTEDPKAKPFKCCYRKRQRSVPGQGELATYVAVCQTECLTPPKFSTTPKQIPQLCKTTTECGDAGVCAEKTCDGFKLHVCGAPEGCL